MNSSYTSPRVLITTRPTVSPSATTLSDSVYSDHATPQPPTPKRPLRQRFLSSCLGTNGKQPTNCCAMIGILLCRVIFGTCAVIAFIVGFPLYFVFWVLLWIALQFADLLSPASWRGLDRARNHVWYWHYHLPNPFGIFFKIFDAVFCCGCLCGEGIC